MNITELVRKAIGTIDLCASDSILLTVHDANDKTITLAEHTITAKQSMTVDTAIVFRGEHEGRRSLGGMVLEKKSEAGK